MLASHAWLRKAKFLWEGVLVGEEVCQKGPTLLTLFGGKVGGNASSLFLTELHAVASRLI